GGTPEGTNQQYKGCSDNCLPIEDKQIIIPYQLYFSKHSSIWEDSGVAFIKWQKNQHAHTLGRMYLIKQEQFVEVVRQENASEPNDHSIEIDIEATISNGFSNIQANWYSRIVYLGVKSEHPIFTFTAKWPDEKITLNPPGEKYLKTIIRGIKETYQLPQEKILDYVKNLPGVKNQIRD
ncbi:MAG: hypothetical protein KAJ51_14670, partial [Thermoplasmata archaeon]|nr:hypothetical protein [Thermoplasmata archaeon]